MKKKLFAVVMVLSIYFLFILVFTTADSQGHISQFFEDIQLSDNSATAFQAAQLGAPDSDIALNASFREPWPKPKRPQPKKPKVR